MIAGSFRFIIDLIAVYLIFLLTFDVAHLLFGKQRRKQTQNRSYGMQNPAKKEPYRDVQDAKFKE